ncbi:MAG: hypothetical protein KU37_10935 [Sulfuricurvum sp. PC08-66]|nr:MAG: hypothetical protein KU37_10935 [Sulfuricurvum sp. PC08-66]
MFMALSLALLPTLVSLSGDTLTSSAVEIAAEEKSSTAEIEKEGWMQAAFYSWNIYVSSCNATYAVDNFHPQRFISKIYKPPIVS